MTLGELLLRGSAWASLLAWAVAEWERGRGPGARSRARAWFSGGALALLVHSLAAFHVRYAWSQAAALRDTARQTQAATGIEVEAGLYVNYAFALLWMAEVGWWWRSPAGHARRGGAVDRAVRAVFLFMFLNGAFLFVRGPQRWLGAAVLLAVAAAWYRPVGARLDDA